MPWQNAQKAEEDHDSKLKDVLDPVHLVILVGVLGNQLGGAVGQELVLLDDDVPLDPDAAKVTELYQGEVRLEHEDVVELDIQVAEVFRVYPLQGRANLTADPLCMYLPQSELRDVGGEVAEGGVLHREHEVAVALEHGVVHPEDVLVWPQSDAALVLATELVRRHQVGVDRLEDHLVPGGPVLRKVDPGVPALAD